MATTTLLGSLFNTTSGTHSVTATPALGDVIVIVVANTGNTASVAPTDNNLNDGTYTLINSAVKAASADTMQVWIRNAPTINAVSTVFTHAPGTSTGGGLAVYKITGMSLFGLAAIRQSAIQSNIASGTPTPVLGSAALTGNPIISAVFSATNPSGLTARGTPAYTRDVNAGYATPTAGFASMHINSGETGTSIAWGSSSASAFCSLVIELSVNEGIQVAESVLLGNYNAAPSSQVFQSTWSLDGGTVVDNAAVAPDGTTTAASFTTATFGDGVFIFPGLFTQSHPITFPEIWTFSVYFKNSSGSALMEFGSDQASLTSGTTLVQVNTSTGAITFIDPTIIASSVTNVGNGWFRFSGSFVVSPGLQNGPSFIIYADAAVAGVNFVWGAQLNPGLLTPYLKNTSTTAGLYSPNDVAILSIILQGINVSDTVTVTESVTIQIVSNQPTVNVSDTVVVTENIQMQIVDSINVSDTITVTEFVQMQIVDFVSVSDTVVVTENVQFQVVSPISVFDTVVITEGVTLRIVEQGEVVSDTVVVTEFVQMQIVDFISVSDTVAITENVQMQVVDFINVSDTVVITESVVLTIVSQNPTFSVSDTVMVTEFVSLQITPAPSVSDTVVVTEFVQLAIVSLPSVSDTVVLSEQVALVIVFLPSVSDTVTVTENIKMQVVDFISVSDTVVITESITLAIKDSPVVSDTIAVTEFVQMQIVDSISVNDIVTVTESISLNIGIKPSVFDTVTITEFVRLQIVEQGDIVSDTITITEFVKMQIVDFINVFDVVTVTDTPIFQETLLINVSDTVLVGEKIFLTIPINIFVSDSITITEFVSLRTTLPVIFDTVTVTEFVQLNIVSFINVSDTITVTDVFEGGIHILINAAELDLALGFHFAPYALVRETSFVLSLGWKQSGYTLVGDREPSTLLRAAQNKSYPLTL